MVALGLGVDADNVLGNEGVRRLYVLILHHCLPSLRQLFLLNNHLSTDVIHTLVSINSMETNVINIVIPETQLAQCTQRERQIIQTLYTRIEANAVKSLEIAGGCRASGSL